MKSYYPSTSSSSNQFSFKLNAGNKGIAAKKKKKSRDRGTMMIRIFIMISPNDTQMNSTNTLPEESQSSLWDPEETTMFQVTDGYLGN